MSLLRLLRAEWTKLRTVPAWVAAPLAGAAIILALGLTPSRQGSCGQHGPGSECAPLRGPGGQEVTDGLTLVHRTLTGDGTLTARVAALTGRLPDDGPATRDGLAPWAKAGLIVKDGTAQGSAYAAVMLTGEHGVRLQYDYVHDEGQPADARIAPAPVWLRLTRTGDVVTAERSADGVAWTGAGTARLPGLPRTVTAGLFVTSPQYAAQVNQAVVLSGTQGGPSQAIGTFDHLATAGAWSGEWQGTVIGARGGPAAGPRTGWAPTADGFALTGSGDIAPSVSGGAGLGVTISQTLAGTFLSLVAVVVVGALFVTAEYRRGLIRTTLAAAPRRGRVLAAKAAVLGAAGFVLGLAAAAPVVAFGPGVLRGNGVYVHPATLGTELRVVAGTAALLAGCAVLALGLGTLLRRGVAAVVASIVLVVLPYLLSVTVLPLRAADWLLRVTPAAAFALQQSEPRYAQIDNVYSPVDGYFPLGPWAGLAVLAGWVAVALAAAWYALRRRDT
ncbi:ABC transporter permease subunit [Dactylosporangium sp. CA-092794]|uniref:ABC transporter permease subunit n=1 Tax=Dactylosporangium sp. CA-092794 TaxID=3239929 RepID=UPI003D8B9E76